MAIVKLNQKNRRVELSSFELGNELVFEFFDNLQVSERDEKLLNAIHIGVVALAEDRIASFLSKTSNELGVELESLKLIYDMQYETFFKSTQKGLDAERVISNFLSDFFKERNLQDSVALTGNASGELDKNKTGDIVCDVLGKSQNRIVIECKFDKSIRLGELEKVDISKRKSDTIIGQLIESEVNRNAKMSIVVLDASVICLLYTSPSPRDRG